MLSPTHWATCYSILWRVEEEVQSSLSEFNRKSKTKWTEQWKFDVNRIKNERDMTFINSVIFIETFLEQSIWIWVSWWCQKLPHNFYIFVHRNDENPIVQRWESKTCLKSTLNKCRCLLWYILIWGHAFTCLSNNQKKKNQHFIYKINFCEAMRSSTRSFA